MGVIGKYAIKSLKYDWRKSTLTTLTISLSVVLITLIFTVGMGLKDMYAQTVMYNQEKWNISFYDFTTEEIEAITQEIDDIEVVANIQYFNAYNNQGEDAYIVNMDINTWIDEFMPGRVENKSPEISEGRLPTKNNELLFVQSVSDETKLGDIFTDDAGNIFEVVGIADGNGVFSYLRGELIANQPIEDRDDTMIITYLKFKPGSKNVKEQVVKEISKIRNVSKEDLEHRTQENEGLNSVLGMRDQTLTTEDITTLSLTCFLVGIIILTTIALVYNSLEMFIFSHIKEIGILRSVGMTDKQTKRLLWIQSLTLTVVAIVLGIGLGYGSALLMTDIIFRPILSMIIHTNNVYFTPKLDIYIVGLIIFFSVILSYIPIRRLSKRIYSESSIENLKDEQISKKIKPIKLNETKLLKQLAYTQVKTNRKKYSGMRFSLIITIVLFCSLIIGYRSIIDMSMSYSDDYDLAGSIDSNASNINAIEKNIDYSSIDEMKSIKTIWNADLVSENGEPVALSDKYRTYISETYDEESNEKMENTSRGLSMYILPDSQWSEGISIFNRINVRGDYTNDEGENGAIIMNETDFNKLFVPEFYSNYSNIMYEFRAKTEDSAKVTKEIEKTITDLDEHISDSILDRNAVDATLRVVTQGVRDIITVISVIILIAVILNLISTTLSTIYSRKQEIAIYKSIGMRQEGVYKMILWENYYILKSVLVVGIGLSVVVYIVINMIMKMNNPYVKTFDITNLESILVAVAAVGIIYLINLWVSYRELKNRNIIEDIRKY